MKFRRLPVIVLVAGILVAYYALGTNYLQERREKAGLSSQIAGAAAQRELIPPPPADIEPRLAAASAELAREKNSIPARMNSTRLVNGILRTAEAAGVKAVPVFTQPWVIETADRMEYAVFRLNLAACGTFTQLADFLNRLENGETATLVVTDMKVERVTGAPASENATGDAAEVEARLDIAVYARPPVTAPLAKVK